MQLCKMTDGELLQVLLNRQEPRTKQEQRDVYAEHAVAGIKAAMKAVEQQVERDALPKAGAA